MPTPRLIRIEGVRFDWLSEAYVATAVRREANGTLSRRRLSLPGDPIWDHGRATRALERHADRVL